MARREDDDEKTKLQCWLEVDKERSHCQKYRGLISYIPPPCTHTHTHTMHQVIHVMQLSGKVHKGEHCNRAKRQRGVAVLDNHLKCRPSWLSERPMWVSGELTPRPPPPPGDPDPSPRLGLRMNMGNTSSAMSGDRDGPLRSK